MIKHKLFFAFVLLSLLLSGCARPNVQLDRVLVYNASAEMITDVMVQHEPTKRVGAVSMILPGKSLDIGFPRQPMIAEKGIVSWRDGSGRSWEVELPLPYDSSAASEGRAMALVYMISASGNASVSIQ